MRKIISCLGIVLGIVSIVFSMAIFFNMDNGHGVPFDNEQWLGGVYVSGEDAEALLTDIYYADLRTARNTACLAGLVQYGTGYLLMVIGIGIILLSAYTLCPKPRDKATPAPYQQPYQQSY